jgi:hypothetical protein
MKAISILLLLTASCSAPARQESNVASPKAEKSSATASPKIELQLQPVAGDRSEPLFSEPIQKRAEQANLPWLKSKNLRGDDLEFRVWIGFGKAPLEAFVVSRSGGQWQGRFLERINIINKPPYRRELSPRSGWEQLWSELVDAGLLTLPDSSQLKSEVRAFDGTSYVVEVKQGDVYRTYAYLNPYFQKWQEAKQMLRIADLLYTRFGIKRQIP